MTPHWEVSFSYFFEWKLALWGNYLVLFGVQGICILLPCVLVIIR